MALVLAAPAQAAETAVIVVDDLDLTEYSERGAVGLMVPGAGSEVSRRGALASLVRGEVETALTGGVPEGKPLVELADGPAEVTFYVALPPPGTQPNDKRYPLAVVGGGYRGILESSSTRIPGFVSIADVATSALALERGDEPRITSRPAQDPLAELRQLERNLTDSQDARFGADLVLIASMLLASLGALKLRSPLLGRAAVLAAPAGLSLALFLSALDVETPAWVIAALAGGVPLLALAGAAAGSTRTRLLALLLAFLAGYALVLALWPEVNSLAAIGPHPYGGGRFYGLTNQTATLLLAPALAAGALTGMPWLAAVALLALALVGLSATGADGGGVLVLLVGFGVLALRLAELRLTARRLTALGAGAVVAGLLVVGLDAAAGGSSHVTRSLGSGPGSFADDLAHRAEVSFRGPTSSPMPFLVTSAGLLALVWLATRRPRHAVVDAMLVAVGVSLVVNDTPQDVALFGALGALALLAWRRTDEWLDSKPMRRLALILASLVLAFPVAGCGGGDDVDTGAENVETSTTDTGSTDEGSTDEGTTEEGTTEGEEEAGEGDPAKGKTVFASAGCGSCHTLSDAGSSGSVGPNLDDAKPDTAEVVDKVTNGAGVMPSFKDQLSEQEIQDVAAYVSSTAGS